MKNEIKAFTQSRLDHVVATITGMDWERKEVYGDFLAQVYFYVSHTTRILAAAGSRFALDRQDIHQSCLKHAAEEKSHELLSFNDLKAIGYSPKDFPELPSTKSLYRSAYYLIEHVNPIAIVGYAYFLECLTVAGGPQVLDRVDAKYGKKASRHLTVHVKEDPGHIEAVEKMLAAVPEFDSEALKESITTVAAAFEGMLLEVTQRSGSQRGRKAA